MRKKDMRQMVKYTRRENRRRIWKKIVQTMACVVVFCTTYALILPAITMEQQYICGKEEHTHSAECYTGSGSTQTVCTQNVHAHVSECYGEDGVLCCGFGDVLLHAHDAFCLDAQGGLICAIAEAAEHVHGEGCYTSTGHSHENACYEARRGELICELPEDEGHAHTDGCFVMLTDVICGLEETPVQQVLSCGKEQLQAHTHEAACLDAEGQYSCGKPEVHSHQHTQECIFTDLQLICEKEEHVHDELCKVDLNADVETAEDWEKTMDAAVLTGQWAEDLTAIAATQLGYEESDRNFLSEGDIKKGYTRYGAWYGTPYGDWDAMFVSFCLHYAGIPEEAISYNHNAETWAAKLQEAELLCAPEGYTPVPGDLVFFADELETVTHMGIVAGLEMENDPATGAEVLAQIRTIEGDAENKVLERRVEIGGSAIYGYVSLAAVREDYEQRLAAAETNAGTTEAVEETTEATEETRVETTGEAIQLLTQSAETENYLVTVTYSAELELPEDTELRVVEYAKDSDIFRQRCAEAGYELDWLLNIGFFLGEEELDLDGAFDVVVTSKQGEALGSDITHFAESGAERIDGAEEGAAVAFSADSFSDFGGGVATVADATATTLYFTTVDPTELESDKKYVIYTVSGDIYTFMFSDSQSLDARPVDVTNQNISQDGETWTLTTDQMGTTDINKFTWCVEAGSTSNTVKLALQGWDNADTEKYPGPEYLAMRGVDYLTTWNSTGTEYIDLTITKKTDGAGTAACVITNTTHSVDLLYNTSTTEWTTVATGSGTNVYFAEVSTVCSHKYSFSASFPAKCDSTTATATRTCSVCGDTRTVTASTDIQAIRSYASQLQTSNVKDDYSGGMFTWDTEAKTRGWTYYNGVMLDAFMEIGTDAMHDYVVEFYDDVLETDGTPKGYISGEVDSVPMALALFDLLGDGTGTEDQRYIKAIQYVYNQLSQQTELGAEYGYNLWHKTTSDSWATWKFGLDGIYMANTFLMEYANTLADDSTAEEIYTKVYTRLNWVANTMYDSTKGLYHHGWNGTNGNGHFWGRGIGWYAVALVDIIDMMPDGTYKTNLIGNLPKLFDGMLKYQDEATGMWYNVVDCDATLTDNNGNKLETSVSSMMAYAMMKAYREGFVTDAKYYEAGLRALNGIVGNKMTGSEGSYSVIDTYKSSGVKESDADYLTNDYTTNEAKGVGALIMAAAPDHSWGNWTPSNAVATAAETTTVQTTETRTCSVCGATQSRTVTVEETVQTPTGYTLTVVDPTQLKADEVYAIYSAEGDATYNFLMATQKNPPNVKVDTTTYQAGGYTDSAKNIGESWYVPATYFTSEGSFTYTAEPQANKTNVFWLGMCDYGAGDADGWAGPEYMYLNGEIDTYYSGGGASRLDLTITRVDSNSTDGAATVVRTNATDNKLTFAADGSWTATATPTNVYFAKVTPVYETEEETYTFQVLGTDGPVEGKRYVIYYQEVNVDETSGAKTLRNNIKFLLSNAGATSHGVNGVSTADTLHTAGERWTLNESDLGDHALAELEWTVVEVGEEWYLQSVSDPTLHLKLVCTDTNGSSKVTATAYDEQGAQYFELTFTSSGDPADSYYTATSDEGKNQLYFFQTQNKWNAITQTYEQSNSPYFYFAEVVDDSTEEDSSNDDVKLEEQVVGYDFITLDPTTLYDGQIVTIYTRPDSNDPDTYTFAYSTDDVPAVKVSNTEDETNPTKVDGKWYLTTDQMGSSIGAFTWKVIKNDDGTTTLQSMGLEGNYYLRLMSGEASLRGGTSGDTAFLIEDNTTGNAPCVLKHGTKTTYLVYDSQNEQWISSTPGTTIYFASVSEKKGLVEVPNNYPEAVETGSPSVDTLRFYNFVANDGHVAALANCKFVIRGADEGNKGYTYTIVSGDNPELHLPSDIPTGDFTIEEVSAPEDYLRDVNPKRSFTITTEGGHKVFVGSTSIGTFLNHAQKLLDADKVAEVEDYNNRTYQIMLSAESDLRLYDMNPVDVLFVVDQSNSMLFPAGLNPVKDASGQEVKVNIYRNEGLTATLNNGSNNNTTQLEQLVADKTLSKDQVYYIIADANVTSTVYALWWNGVDWMYQDASYYAKAYQNNKVGYQQDDELAIFPDVAAFDEQPTEKTIDGVSQKVKANGGSLSYDIGRKTALGAEIAATVPGTTRDQYGDIINEGTVEEYTIYTATNGYNRLHYLQDSLAHAIHQLADANDQSTVSLIRFTKETYHDHCIEPKVLSPENVQDLINEVENIKTDGGTRQDIALEHAYDHLTAAQNVTVKKSDGTTETVNLPNNYTKGAAYTFTVLITDGAPVLSSDHTLHLGTAGDAIPTDAAMQNIVTEDVPTGEEGSEVTEKPNDYNQKNGITVYSSIKYWGDKVGINNFVGSGSNTEGESILMTVGLGMGAVHGGKQVLGEIATGGANGGNHMIIDNAEQLMNALKQLLFHSMVPREKVDLMADVTDVISDSFYPIAWVAEGQAPTDRKLLTMTEPVADAKKDWIILEPGDWITVEGEYIGLTQGTTGAGQLLVIEDDPDTTEVEPNVGSYYIKWDDQVLYDCQLVWVPTLTEVPSDRQVVMTEESVKDEYGNVIRGTDGTTYGRYWFALKENDYVYAHGEYVNPSKLKTGTGSLLVGEDDTKVAVPYGFVKEGMTYMVAGQYVKEEGADRAHINWNLDLDGNGEVDTNYYDVDFDANFQPYNWYGKFYVKAKEDFIGGNAIDTNKTAQVAAQENDGDSSDEFVGTVTLETPTVNVRLLDMNENNSKVTVFLGDIINSGETDDPLASPLDSLKDFFKKTYFEKLHADHDGKALVMNGVDTAIADDGLETDKFYLKYAMGGLTDDQWTSLTQLGENGEPKKVIVDYTYDNPSSDGPVGYFTFQLTKTGDTSKYEAHEATVACSTNNHTAGTDGCCTAPVETYTLHVTYTAYELSTDAEPTPRPKETVNNDDTDIDGDGKGPGTEVGGEDAGNTLPTGLGIVDKDNVHKVHVISGAIEVTKEIEDALISNTDQEYEFQLSWTGDAADILHELIPDGTNYKFQFNDKSEQTQGTLTFKVTVPAGSKTSNTVRISNLPRGEYTLTENILGDYHVAELTVDEGATNCYHTTDANAATNTPAKKATFHIGWDEQKDEQDNLVNVIGKTVENDVTADYTSYIKSPNGVFGAAKVKNDINVYTGEVPITKIWADGEDHAGDTIYLLLYRNGVLEKETVTITHEDGTSEAKTLPRVLKISKPEDANNQWSTKITVPLATQGDEVGNYTFTVKEIEQPSPTQPDETWIEAILDEDGDPNTKNTADSIVYYENVEGSQIITIGGQDYLPEYETTEDGTLTVTNHRARVLPESGGMGTDVYTFSGWLLIAAALMYYGYIRRRKREGRAVE